MELIFCADSKKKTPPAREAFSLCQMIRKMTEHDIRDLYKVDGRRVQQSFIRIENGHARIQANDAVANEAIECRRAEHFRYAQLRRALGKQL